MIKHVVMWKFKDEAEGRTRMENMEMIRERLLALPPVIPTIKKMEIGFDVRHTAASADLVLCTEFEDLASLEAYITHPAHVAVGDSLLRVIDTRAVVDYEI